MQSNDVLPTQRNTSIVTHNKSRCLYVRGINRRTTADLIRCHFSICGEVERLVFSENPRLGYGWVHFITQESADRAERELHHSSLNGCIISVRFELGEINETGQLVQESRKQSACVPRFIKETTSGKRKNKSKASKANVSYKGQSILVGDTEYPIPQGRYLMKVLKLCHSSQIGNRQPLIDALLESRQGNRHPKEISESMAMVNAVQILGQLKGIFWENTKFVNVYVLADGLIPFTSITMSLFYPLWNYVSIDPILDYDSKLLGEFSSRIQCFRSLSQDFQIDANIKDKDGPFTNIVVACHSHAPLQEFYDRVPDPKFCIAMPCCGKTWSHLKDTPIHVYDDFEVLSPKRKIYLY